ncbi:MAG: 6-bladed beta-propeller [Candidatus Zhuqueibacterota bacterium]
MMNENRNQSHKITRRKFLKTSLALSAASAISFSFPKIVRSTPATLTIRGFIDPYGVAVSPNGTIYVTDAGGYCVHIFDEKGTPIRRVGQPGSGAGQFNYPQGIAIDADTSDVYVVDSNNGRVVILDALGNYKQQFGAVGGYPEAFYTPKGIFVRDKIYVCNTRNHMLAVYDKSTLSLVANFGDLGDDPKNLARGSSDYRFRIVTDVAVAENGTIYVVDSKHGQVKVLSSDGMFQFKFSENGSGKGQLNLPEAISLDGQQNVYVCDTVNGRIQKFTPEGGFIGVWTEGLKRPVSISIDAASRLYVTDSELKQVNVFSWSM